MLRYGKTMAATREHVSGTTRGPLVDTHCHLTHPKLRGDRDDVIARARDAGVVACVTIGTGVADALDALRLRHALPDFVRCAVGIDPFSAHAAGDAFDDDLGRLADTIRGGGVSAVGEIGLDYHYDLDPRPLQAQRFERQLDLAVAVDLPVVVHVREAHADLAAILAAHPRARGVIHSFTAGPVEAARYLELGWFLAFNGVVTFPKADTVREAARIVPLDRLLIETDSPYLAPVPHRGRRCEPAFVRETLLALASARGEDVPSLAARTSANAATLFRLEGV